jgi:hypothetical protein
LYRQRLPTLSTLFGESTMANQNQSRFAAKDATPKLSASIDGNFLVVRIPLEAEGTRTKSGKNVLLASTHGNKSVAMGNDVIKLGCSAYVE